MEVHAVVDAALAGERPDLRLAAVVEQLDAEGVLEIAAQRRRQRLRGREPDAVGEIAARVEPERARRVAQVGEEARRPRVHGRAPRLGELDLQLAVSGPAVEDET